ncbi:MAG: hypothetical protein ACLTCL_08635 [Mediterraneibacter gnavus]
MSIGLYIVLAPLYLKSVRKLQEKRFVFVKILAIIIPENGAKVSKIKCFQFAQQTLLSIFIPVSGRISTTVYGLWFLPCLFLANIAVYGLEYLYRSKKQLALFSYIVGSAGCIIFYEITGIASILSILPFAVLWLLCGVKAKGKLDKIKLYSTQIIIVMGILFVIFVGMNYRISHVRFDLSSMTMGVWPLYILSGLAGTFFTICISIQLEKMKILAKIGKDSLLYYGLHFEVLGVIDKVVNIGIFQMVITIFILWWIILVYNKIKKKIHSELL